MAAVCVCPSANARCPTAPCPYPPPAAALHTQVNECTAELKANLQEEHLAGMEFIGTVFKTILSPLQKARAIVQSYPFYPDVYQIATVLAMEREGVGAGGSIGGVGGIGLDMMGGSGGLGGGGGTSGGGASGSGGVPMSSAGVQMGASVPMPMPMGAGVQMGAGMPMPMPMGASVWMGAGMPMPMGVGVGSLPMGMGGGMSLGMFGDAGAAHLDIPTSYRV